MVCRRSRTSLLVARDEAMVWCTADVEGKERIGPPDRVTRLRRVEKRDNEFSKVSGSINTDTVCYSDRSGSGVDENC